MAARNIDDRIIRRALNHTTPTKASITRAQYVQHLHEAEYVAERADAFTK